jgi:pyruvate/2-oxoglutarate dehydrogenase complex dihydrolipoamide acyltransferase (E2) component
MSGAGADGERVTPQQQLTVDYMQMAGRRSNVHGLVERETDGGRIGIPHVVRRANRRTVRSIHGELRSREFLSLTVTFDHDVVDGAPATRFVQRLGERIESCHGIDIEGTG